MNTNMKNLSSICMSSCELYHIDESIFNLKNLTKLDVSDNHINIIPEKIANLSNLEHLDLSNNEITNLPESITSLRKLKYLNLLHNQIETFTYEQVYWMLELCSKNNCIIYIDQYRDNNFLDFYPTEQEAQIFNEEGEQLL